MGIGLSYMIVLSVSRTYIFIEYVDKDHSNGPATYRALNIASKLYDCRHITYNIDLTTIMNE